MVSPQATQDSNTPNPRPNDWHRGDDSVRITAQDVPVDVCRLIIARHYAERLAHQQVVVDAERADRKANGDAVLVATHADMRVSNTIAVLQDISSTLKAYSDNNRDF